MRDHQSTKDIVLDEENGVKATESDARVLRMSDCVRFYSRLRNQLSHTRLWSVILWGLVQGLSKSQWSIMHTTIGPESQGCSLIVRILKELERCEDTEGRQWMPNDMRFGLEWDGWSRDEPGC